MRNSNATFIAISNAVREHWIKKGLPSERIKRIYNIVKVDYRSNAIKNDSNTLKLLMVGSFVPGKGHVQIIEALSKLPEDIKDKVSIDFVGACGKTDRIRIEKCINKYGVNDNINFLGYQNNFGEHISGYDCGVMCSISEGLGRVTIEYMLNGIPVIASNTGANPELIDDGVTGFFYKLNDIDDLCKKVMRIYDKKNDGTLIEMGKMAREISLAKFDEKKLVNEIFEVYDIALNSYDYTTVKSKE